MARFTREELERRARREDAAVVVDNVVYDVTRFLDEHPGGADVLLANAGGDASQCFRNVGHSADALRLRERFRIGEVAEDERWPAPPAPPAPPEEPEAPGAPGLRAALQAVAPPLLLGALAVALHALLFP